MPTAAPSTSSLSPLRGLHFVRAAFRRRRQLRGVRHWSTADSERASFYGQFVQPGDLVFDVGANMGNRVKVFLKLGARVVAIEPQPSCVEFLDRAFSAEQHFSIEPTAVGAELGQASMMLSRESTIASLATDWVEAVSKSGRFDRSLWQGEATVPITTLDHLIEKHGEPDFLKIDIEGYEEQALQGLSRQPKGVSLEFVPEALEKSIACIDRLEALGPMKYRLSLEESMSFTTNEFFDRDSVVAELRRIDPGDFADIYAFAA